MPGGEGFCKSGAQSRGEWAAFQARLQHGVMGVAWHGIVTYIFHGKRLPGQAGESGQPRWCLFHGQPMRQPVRRPVPRCADAWRQPGAEDTPTGLLAPPLPRGGSGTQRGRARRLLTQRMATAHTAGTRHTRSHAGDGPGSRPSAAPIPSPYIRPRAGQGGERGGRGRGPGRGHRGAVPAAARRAGGRPRPPAALAAAAARRRSARSRPAWIPDIGSGFLSWGRAWRSIARRIACTPCHTMPKSCAVPWLRRSIRACRSRSLLGPRQAIQVALPPRPRRRQRRRARTPSPRTRWRCPCLTRLLACLLPRPRRTSARRRRGRRRRGAPSGRQVRHGAKRGRRRSGRAAAHQQGRRPATKVCLVPRRRRRRRWRRRRRRRRRRRPRERRSGQLDRRRPAAMMCAVRHGLGRRLRHRSSGRLRGWRPAGGRCRRGRQRARRSRRWASACR